MRNKSIEFLLKNAGPVIQYRLKKEIMGSITAQEENFSDFVSHFSFSADYISESITQALGVRI